MSKLLRANFARLWKTTIFWICMIAMFAMGIWATMSRYILTKTERQIYSIDGILFSGAMFMPVVAAVFIGLFIGTDYSDGTIRNKLIVGHTRQSVYLSNLIVCVSALIMIHLVYIFTIIAVGIPLFLENFETSVSNLVELGLISIVTVIALSSVFLLMSMLIHNKSNASVALIILSFVFLIIAMTLSAKLDVTGYVSGTKRTVYEFLYDFLPGCQMRQIAEQNPENPERLPLYSLLITVVTTACGIFFFRRKDLK